MVTQFHAWTGKVLVYYLLKNVQNRITIAATTGSNNVAVATLLVN